MVVVVVVLVLEIMGFAMGLWLYVSNIVRRRVMPRGIVL